MPRRRRDRPPPPEMPPCAEADASFVSRLLFHWVHPLIHRGSSLPLQAQDLPPLQPRDTAAHCRPIFHATYRQVATADRHHLEQHHHHHHRQQQHPTAPALPTLNQTTPPQPPPPLLNRLAAAIPPRLLSKTYRALIPIVFAPFATAAAAKPVWLAAAVGQTFAIRALVDYVLRASTADPNLPSRWVFVPVALALALAAHIMSIASHATFSRSMRAGMRARAAVTAEIFRKTLRLSPQALSRTTDGKMGNMLLNDTQRVLDSFTYFHFCWLGFLEISVLAGLLCIDLGLAAVFGVIVLLLLIPAQLCFSVLVKRARARTTAQVDVRVQKMTEILSGIRTVKLSAWEPHFMNIVTDLRVHEVKHLKVAAVLRAINAAVFFAAPVMVALATFTARTLIFGLPLSPPVVFSSLSYFWSISMSLNLMPLGYLSASEASVSSCRLDAFFDLPELASIPSEERLDIANILPEDETPASDSSSLCELSDVDDADITDDDLMRSTSVDVTQGSLPRLWAKQAQFCYAQSGQTEAGVLSTVLTNVNLSAWDGQLLSIVGPVGSGKSSLLLGLLGELQCTSGEVHKVGKVAYCSQQPWIVNGTLRENITMFGADDDSFDRQWYETVLNACCLLPDIQLLPAGDLTEIGERGVNLSGGQKARVSLARAVFSRADIYLLDDPLSAVDVAVSGRLIRTVFGRNGLLADKVQLVVTHQLNLLPVSSKIVVLGGGTVDHCGTFAELRDRGVEFTGFSGLEDDLDKERSHAARESEEFEDEHDLAPSEESRLRQILKDANVDVGVSELRKSSEMEPTKCNASKEKFEAQEGKGVCGDVLLDLATDACDVGAQVDVKSRQQCGGLVEEEDRHIGHVTGNVYHKYIKAGGGYGALVAVASGFVLAQTIRQVSEWWLSRWSNIAEQVEPDELDQENRFHALVFFALTAFTMIFTLLRAAVFAERTMCASKNMHNDLLKRVLHGRPSFFDTNPLGRILNRFSKDIDQMDSMLPIAAQDFLQISFVALGALITIAVILPWFILPLIPIVAAFMLLQRMYKMSSRELKRLEAISRSPLYAQFVETANGLPTIRAFQTEDRFSSHFNSQMDENHCAYHMFASAGRWLGIRLDALAAMVSLCTSIVVLILSPTLNPGLAGVALTQSVVLTGNFQWGIRQAAETENLFTSVERVAEMATQTPVEKPYEIPDKKPEPTWPSEGRICFEDVTLKYRPELDPALQNLSFKTSRHERVGIVGRTGSGKSSLFVSLFRMVELFKGSIFIDGVDIAAIGLHDLRSRMAIVPQDPVLFNGTIRSNLDPKGIYNDAQLWDALYRVHMKSAIEGIGGALEAEGHGLDLIVEEKGSNFSAGERQLLALARVILSGVKIVVLDEASASLDNHTDMLVQKTVREQLSDRTVLTIAHRLATIADSDRVLVMDAGEVVEFDSPSKLLESGGYFAKLVEGTGRIESAILRAIISEASNPTKASKKSTVDE